MRPNPVLRKLGFADDDRVAIIHADDIGMCQATLTAFAELLDFGLVSCGAAMVPCPWFPSVAAYAAAHPDADIGVHLTLNCEYSAYRWGALSTRDPASGLLDADGCFFRLPADTQRRAEPAAVRAELEAQVAHALAAGIDVSHVDTHMGTVAHRKFAAAYVETALTHRLPLMLMRYDEAGWRARGLDGETAADLGRAGGTARGFRRAAGRRNRRHAAGCAGRAHRARQGDVRRAAARHHPLRAPSGGRHARAARHHYQRLAEPRRRLPDVHERGVA